MFYKLIVLNQDHDMSEYYDQIGFLDIDEQDNYDTDAQVIL